MLLDGRDEEGRTNLLDRLYGTGGDEWAKGELRKDMAMRGLDWEDPDAG